jgi:hypothetical protein
VIERAGTDLKGDGAALAGVAAGHRVRPVTEAVQVEPVQETCGAIANVVVDVTSAILLSYWSRDSAV